MPRMTVAEAVEILGLTARREAGTVAEALEQLLEGVKPALGVAGMLRKAGLDPDEVATTIAVGVDLAVKGVRAAVGEERTWEGIRYRKVAEGAWESLGKAARPKADYFRNVGHQDVPFTGSPGQGTVVGGHPAVTAHIPPAGGGGKKPAGGKPGGKPGAGGPSSSPSSVAPPGVKAPPPGPGDANYDAGNGAPAGWGAVSNRTAPDSGGAAAAMQAAGYTNAGGPPQGAPGAAPQGWDSAGRFPGGGPDPTTGQWPQQQGAPPGAGGPPGAGPLPGTGGLPPDATHAPGEAGFNATRPTPDVVHRYNQIRANAHAKGVRITGQLQGHHNHAHLDDLERRVDAVHGEMKRTGTAPVPIMHPPSGPAGAPPMGAEPMPGGPGGLGAPGAPGADPNAGIDATQPPLGSKPGQGPKPPEETPPRDSNGNPFGHDVPTAPHEVARLRAHVDSLDQQLRQVAHLARDAHSRAYMSRMMQDTAAVRKEPSPQGLSWLRDRIQSFLHLLGAAGMGALAGGAAAGPLGAAIGGVGGAAVAHFSAQKSLVIDKRTGALLIRIEPARDVLVKAGPGAGWMPIQNSKHGGFRRGAGPTAEYWYPDKASAQGAAQHHAAEADREQSRADELHGYARGMDAKVKTQGPDGADTLRGAADILRTEAQKHATAAGEHRETSIGASAHAAAKEGEERQAAAKEAETAQKQKLNWKPPSMGWQSTEPHPQTGAVGRVMQHEAGQGFAAMFEPKGDMSREQLGTHKTQQEAQRAVERKVAEHADAQPTPAGGKPAGGDATGAQGSGPPAGFKPIPGSKHGGHIKGEGPTAEHWYPSAKNATAAAHFHENEQQQARRDESSGHNAVGRMRDAANRARLDGASKEEVARINAGADEHKRAAERAGARAADHAALAGGARRFKMKLEGGTPQAPWGATKPEGGKKPGLPGGGEKPKATEPGGGPPPPAPASGGGKTPEQPPAPPTPPPAFQTGPGARQHAINDTGENGHRMVDTVHRAGDWAVHPNPDVKGKPGSYTVSHLPTGLSVGRRNTKGAAAALAEHMHANADGKLKGVPWGGQAEAGKHPDAESVMAAMQSAPGEGATTNKRWKPTEKPPTAAPSGGVEAPPPPAGGAERPPAPGGPPEAPPPSAAGGEAPPPAAGAGEKKPALRAAHGANEHGHKDGIVPGQKLRLRDRHIIQHGGDAAEATALPGGKFEWNGKTHDSGHALLSAIHGTDKHQTTVRRYFKLGGERAEKSLGMLKSLLHPHDLTVSLSTDGDAIEIAGDLRKAGVPEYLWADRFGRRATLDGDAADALAGHLGGVR